MAKDPYRYFRIEAQELVESLRHDVLTLEKSAANRELLAKVLRLAHTLKGAARVVRLSEIANLAHKIEDILAPLRDRQAPVPKDAVTRVLATLDVISGHVTGLSPAPGTGVDSGAPKVQADLADPAAPSTQSGRADPATPPVQHGTESTLETVRVDIQEVDRLLEQIALVRAQIAHVKRSVGNGVEALHLKVQQCRTESVETRSAPLLDEALIDVIRLRATVDSEIEKLERVATQSRESANQLRLLPASVILPSLEYAVRDAANVLERNVEFSATGGEIRLDAHVLIGLRDALLHVVRNAVAHGIEAEDERIRIGKPPAGRIELKLERRGGRVALICSDDGRGIDTEAVIREAVSRGRLSAEVANKMSTQELTQWMLQSGISTASTLTEISGRGVGMDVVRDTANRLKGDVSIRSDAGRGTCVEFCVPYSLSSLKVLVLRDGAVTAAIPLDCVSRTQRFPAAELLRSAQGQSLPHESGAIPFMPLSSLFSQPETRGATYTWTVLEIQSSAGRAALGVEQLSSVREWIVSPLPQHIQAHPVLAGASLDAEGAPVVVLSATETIQAITSNNSVQAPIAKVERVPVLVIDDSLTTRMLEQSILESAGYEVELATSAEEGLAKARNRSYALFLVDVEMPGMNGFQFIEAIRAHPGLSSIPAILVTSRDAPSDKERGQSAGANDYIVKGEFDQGRLLRRIRELIGG